MCWAATQQVLSINTTGAKHQHISKIERDILISTIIKVYIARIS